MKMWLLRVLSPFLSFKQPIRPTEVVIDPFYTPDWVQSHEDFAKAMSVHIAEQMDRGVSKANIGEYLVDGGILDPDDVDSYYHSVLDVVKERNKEISKDKVKELVGWGIALAICATLMFVLYIRPQYVVGILPEGMYLVKPNFFSLGLHTFLIIGLVASFAVTVSELWGLLRHIRIVRRLDNG